MPRRFAGDVAAAAGYVLLGALLLRALRRLRAARAAGNAAAGRAKRD